jgi:predicted oxidoreductase
LMLICMIVLLLEKVSDSGYDLWWSIKTAFLVNAYFKLSDQASNFDLCVHVANT